MSGQARSHSTMDASRQAIFHALNVLGVSCHSDEALSIALAILQHGLGPTVTESFSETPDLDALDFTPDLRQKRRRHGSDAGFSSWSTDIFPTAKAVTIRNLFGEPTQPDQVLQDLDRQHSHTASLQDTCDALDAILSWEGNPEYFSEIERLGSSLCNLWLSRDGQNGRNLHSTYDTTRLSLSLMGVLRLDKDPFRDEMLESKILLILFQALLQILDDQDQPEEPPTSQLNNNICALLCLDSLSSLTFLGDLQTQVQSTIVSLLERIQNSSTVSPFGELLTTYLSRVSTTNAPSNPNPSLSTKSTHHLTPKSLKTYTSFFSQLPCGKSPTPQRLLSVVIEGHLFVPLLQKHQPSPFGSDSDDRYLVFIAVTFTFANRIRPFYLSADVLLDMMVLTLRAYQLDEFVEHDIGKGLSPRVEEVKRFLQDMLGPGLSQREGPSTPVDGLLQSICEKLSAFSDTILLHPVVLKSSPYNQALLQSELHEYLTAHMDQLHDSRAFYTNATIPFNSYHHWVRTRGASHVFVAFSLAYLTCLVPGTRNLARTAEETYLTQEIWQHLGRKVRMENDYPSLGRDRKEGNLNSLDFPEFHQGEGGGGEEGRVQLLRIIGREMEMCEMGLGGLEGLVGEGDAGLRVLRFYYFLSDVVGDVYALRDISREAGEGAG